MGDKLPTREEVLKYIYNIPERDITYSIIKGLHTGEDTIYLKIVGITYKRPSIGIVDLRKFNKIHITNYRPNVVIYSGKNTSINIQSDSCSLYIKNDTTISSSQYFDIINYKDVFKSTKLKDHLESQNTNNLISHKNTLIGFGLYLLTDTSFHNIAIRGVRPRGRNYLTYGVEFI